MEAPVESGNGTEVEAHSLIENLFSLAGKTAVVVGGGGVLAGEMAMGLAGAGANIVIADLNEDQAKRHAEAILGLGRKSLACQADVSRKADVQRILEATLEKFGGVDILLNAAGINSGTPFFEIEEAEWERIIAVDLRSIFLACQVFGKAMIEAGKGGSIINISSDPRYRKCSPIRWQRAGSTRSPNSWRASSLPIASA
jgi:NAD(P)-dependent dehydrogenase (short-subunit alcohol dehydrogenase family)